jgi:hypothetical protein
VGEIVSRYSRELDGKQKSSDVKESGNCHMETESGLFLGRNVIVHEHNVLAGFGRARMKLVIVEQQRRGHWWKLQLDGPVCLPRLATGLASASGELRVAGEGFVHAASVQRRVPLVTRSFLFESPDSVSRTVKDWRAIRARLDSADVRPKHIADAWSRRCRIHGQGWQQLSSRQ